MKQEAAVIRCAVRSILSAVDDFEDGRESYRAASRSQAKEKGHGDSVSPGNAAFPTL